MKYRRAVRVIWTSAEGRQWAWFECPTAEEAVTHLTKILLLNDWKIRGGEKIEFINVIQLEKDYEVLR